MKTQLRALIEQGLTALRVAGTLPADLASPEFVIERPKERAHGDFSTNAAMLLARELGVPVVPVYPACSCCGCGGGYYGAYAPGYAYGYGSAAYGYAAAYAPYAYVNRFYRPRIYVGSRRAWR